MEQRDTEVGVAMTAQPETATLPQAELDELYREISGLRQSNTDLRKTVQDQARMFADQQRATPFESAVRDQIKREFNNMTLDLLKNNISFGAHYDYIR